MSPYTLLERKDAIAKGESVVGCWFCLNTGNEEKPYWKVEETTIHEGEHVIRCPKHSDRSLYP